MAIRPIDGAELLGITRLLDTDVVRQSKTASWLLDQVLHDIQAMPTLTPPNDPLTLEQLREMKDEPAYLNAFGPLLKSGWHIIKTVTEDKIIFRGWQTVYVSIDGMGIDYNLYRRPPKEGNERCEQSTGIHWRKK